MNVNVTISLFDTLCDAIWCDAGKKCWLISVCWLSTHLRLGRSQRPAKVEQATRKGDWQHQEEDLFFVTLHFFDHLILQKDGQHQEEDGEAVQRDGGRRVEDRPLWGDQSSEWGWGGQVWGAGNRSGITSEILDWVFQKRQVRNIQKKMQAMESAFDVCTEDLFNQVRGYLVQYCLFKDKSNVGQVHFLAWLGICQLFHVVSSWAVISLLSYPAIWSLSIQSWLCLVDCEAWRDGKEGWQCRGRRQFTQVQVQRQHHHNISSSSSP